MELSEKQMTVAKSPSCWGKKMGGLLPCRAAREPGVLGASRFGGGGGRDSPLSSLLEAKPAPAVSLARSPQHEMKQELQAEQQEMTKATLEQLVTKTSEQLQAEVRSGSSAPSPRRLGGSPWACRRHPAQLRAHFFSPTSSWTSRGCPRRAGGRSRQGAPFATQTPRCRWQSSSSAMRSSRSWWSPSCPNRWWARW